MPRPPRFSHVPEALDVAAFCRDAAQLEGQWSMADLPRLAESVLRGSDEPADAPVAWSAAGSMHRVSGGAEQCRIDLNVGAAVRLECQRCLQPMVVPLQVERRFHFVRGEDEAARLDEELEDDVLALTPRFDLRALIEDELLLALPLVPRHPACDEPTAELRAPEDGAGREAPAANESHPFASLAALRRTKPGD